MDMESLYDYGEEDQDFYEESPGNRKGGYPIDHRSIKVSRYILILNDYVEKEFTLK